MYAIPHVLLVSSLATERFHACSLQIFTLYFILFNVFKITHNSDIEEMHAVKNQQSQLLYCIIISHSLFGTSTYDHFTNCCTFAELDV